MATRRNVYSTEEKEVKEEKRIQSPTDAAPPHLRPKPGSSNTVIVPTSVIIKLIVFTVAMISAPLGSYYVMLKYVTNNNSTLSGATAAIVANFVLIAYVITALNEDDEDNKKKK